MAVTHNRNTAQPLTQFDRIVINDTGQMILHMAAVYEFVGQGTACITGTDDHHILGAPGTAAVGNLDLQLPQEAVRLPLPTPP